MDAQPIGVSTEDNNRPAMAHHLSIDVRQLGATAEAAGHSDAADNFHQKLSPTQINHYRDPHQKVQPEMYRVHEHDKILELEPLIAKQAIELACAHQDVNSPVSITDCLSTIVEYTQSKSLDRVSIFKSLESLAQEYEKRGDLSKSIAAFRLVTSGYEATDGFVSARTLEGIYDLSRVLTNVFATEEAESLYRKAIDGFGKLSPFKFKHRQLGCQHLLGNILHDLGRDKDAGDLYISTLVSYLQITS